ncbi:MAG: ABC transporter permease subunit [Microbacteriaceae bacterium]
MSVPQAAPSRTVRIVILSVIGVIFAIPIVAMVEFTMRAGLAGGYNLDRWLAIVNPENERAYRGLFEGVANSLLLALITVAIILALLVPTMVLVTLRFPRLQRTLEFICLIPITVPAIALVVGLAPVYSVVSRMFGSGTWTLSFAYGIIALPFAYRAIQANLGSIDVVTLSEAARSLGANWNAVLWRVVVPNLKRGMLSASVISVAVVLGEFTIASLLNRDNLQTALVQVSRSDPWVAVIFALLALGFAFILLLIIGRVGTARPGRRTT